jgi:hypothetical protein
VDYKYPFTYLDRIRLFIQIISMPSLSSINELIKLVDLPTQPNPNSFGRKIEEARIYVSTNPYFIPP